MQLVELLASSANTWMASKWPHPQLWHSQTSPDNAAQKHDGKLELCSESNRAYSTKASGIFGAQTLFSVTTKCFFYRTYWIQLASTSSSFNGSRNKVFRELNYWPRDFMCSSTIFTFHGLSPFYVNKTRHEKPHRNFYSNIAKEPS